MASSYEARDPLPRSARSGGMKVGLRPDPAPTEAVAVVELGQS